MLFLLNVGCFPGELDYRGKEKRIKYAFCNFLNIHPAFLCQTPVSSIRGTST